VLRSKARAATLSLLTLAGLLSAIPAMAQWDPTKPTTNSLLVSAEIRNNWVALATQVGNVNLMADPTFDIWSNGDSSAPDHYTVSGASVAIARTGSGLGDTNRKLGSFAAKLTSGAGAVGTLQQQLLNSAAIGRANALGGLDFSAGAWVRATVASVARIGLYDGTGTSYSSFHTGNSTFQWLTVTRTLTASPTALTFRLEVNAGTNAAHISGPTVVFGSVPPSYSMPAPVRLDEVVLTVAGNCATGSQKGGARFIFQRPAIVVNTMLSAGTAPTTQAIIVDVNKSGATMYSTKPQIAATATFGQAAPDSTYGQRSFQGGTGEPLTIDFDQCGTGTVGADVNVHVWYKTYERPLEVFLAPADQN